VKITVRWIFALTVLPLAVSVSATESAKEKAQTRRVMFNYAACVVKARHARASDAILANADNETISRRYSDLIIDSCLGEVAGGGQMKFGGDTYRYALADALVNADYRMTGETDFSNRLPLAHLTTAPQSELDAALAITKSKRRRTELQDQFVKQTGIAWLSRYGECVVRQNPAKARLWLLTRPDVPEETSRINDLRPAFEACLDNGTLKFNRVTMRGTVAINYYRLAMATVQPVAGKAL
jgi:hypothetical protein